MTLTNEPLTNDCHWHPRQDMVALQVLIFRHPSLLWVWHAGHGLRCGEMKQGESSVRQLQPDPFFPREAGKTPK